ncbi:unnamed protein product [Tetraodon nigroviridis]|uniref:(spotted green pufferfish) hypothetical protein n=1 Tax=Tetraodon nigroviridis TaxID=99883 RepID=Q4RND3_TETNG|nr:unnamed protein product [Tetraodon nigroviridis]
MCTWRWRAKKKKKKKKKPHWHEAEGGAPCGLAPLQATGNPPGSDGRASQGSNPFLLHSDQVETWVATF